MWNSKCFPVLLAVCFSFLSSNTALLAQDNAELARDHADVSDDDARQIDPKAAPPALSVLDRRVDVDFQNANLEDVIEKLKADFKLNVRLDQRALAAAGIPWKKDGALKAHRQRMERAAADLADELAAAGVLLPHDAPTLKTVRELPYPGVKFAARDIALRSVLHHVLREVDRSLVYLQRGDVFLITTDVEADNHLITRVYPVGDLTGVREDDAPQGLFEPVLNPAVSPYDMDSLIDLVTSIIDCTSWEEVGGPGAIEPQNQTLIVTQTQRNQEMLQVLLGKLRELKTQGADKKRAVEPLAV